MSNSARTWHPDPQHLAAFAQGRLPAAANKNLKAHLDHCEACRKKLTQLPGAESLSGLATLLPEGVARNSAPPPQAATVSQLTRSDVPADLANHPRYEILQLLGQGGMGAVYQARHKKMNRLVALKVISAQLLGNDKAVERFHREVEAAAKLHHANIVTAHDADQAGGTHFLVMEFIEGTDLAQYVQKKGPLSVAHACHFIRQAALGLQHAHEKGMVHRDIKPHNLMLTVQGVVKIMDFGLARLAREESGGAGLTGENVLMGTADYIAPEQAEDAHNADIRADIYSLGCALYHLLAGKAPFAGGTVVQKIMAHAITAFPLGELPATVPGELRAVLAKMVEKSPAQRYQTPAEIVQALAPFVKKAAGMKAPPIPASVSPAEARGEGTRADDPAKPKRVRKRKHEQRWPLPILIGVIAAVVLIASIFLLASRGRQPIKGSSLRTNDNLLSETKQPDALLSDTKQPDALPPTFKNSLGMEFVLVLKGKSWLGGEADKPGDREVKIVHDFYLGKYEVTQEEWKNVTGLMPSHFSRTGLGKDAVKNIPETELKRFPVEQVSWEDAQLLLERLKKQEKEAGWIYRLPKADEWEYACRGGPLSDKLDSACTFYLDQPTNQLLPEQANFALEEGKGLQRTCKVGSYKPNRLGLYDMHGNVWEWCDDADKAADGTSARVIRGGSWIHGSQSCRAAFHDAISQSARHYHIGLRVARVPMGKERK